MAISNAVSPSAEARVVGYEVKKGNFLKSTPNLPIRIAILGPANQANQAGLLTTPQEIFSAKEAAKMYGAGSPIHAIMRILRPLSGEGVGGIPTVCYAQEDPGSSSAALKTITVTASSVTKNTTHKLYINGRDNVDGMFYDFGVLVGDTADKIAKRISDTINNVSGSPVIATVSSSVVTITNKFVGVVGNELNAKIKFEEAAGVSYAISVNTEGVGAHSITDALTSFGNEWNTIVINCYDNDSILDQLELFNGNINDKTGRYAATVFKPFIALTGSTDSVYVDIISSTSSRKNEMTNVICPAPKSEASTYEAAANMAYLLAINAQYSPESTISGKLYPDMPAPKDGVIGHMSDYPQRDNILKGGSSTVTFNNGKYQVEDVVTTYHPDDEAVPQYQYARTLIIDFNVRYSVLLLEVINVKDKTLVGSNQVVITSNTVKPKGWKAVLFSMVDDLSERALITDADFMKDSIKVSVSSSNPNRLETFFRYKRSAIAKILSTTAEAGFSYDLQ